MKVLILGGGVIGTCTAWYLAKEGHEVTVVDRQQAAAMETSFANAGEVSPGYSAPWAGPGMPFKAIKWMLGKHSPLVVRPRPDIYMMRWLYRMLRNCTHDAYAVNKGRMQRLAHYSRDCLEACREETGIEYDHRTKGTLDMFRDQKGLDDAGKDIKLLEDFGIPFAMLDRDGCCDVEPALRHVKEKVAGGLHLPGDETGDCFKFTTELAKLCVEKGVKFRYGATIKKIVRSGDRIEKVVTDHGDLTADAYVAALGSYSSPLLRPLGVRTQVYPVKGYSVTIPIVDEDGAPQSTMMDEKNKVAITRLGDRIRAAGTAELTGYNLNLTHARCAMIFHVVDDLFPNGGDLSQVRFWTGLRPMVPDGTPVVGPTSYKNLYLNTGHGTLGWTMACGSGKLVSDIVSGNEPDIDTDGLTIFRYPRGQGI